MPASAISVEGLGKVYRISHETRPADSFRDLVVSMLTGPFRRFRRLRGTDEESEAFWALRDVSFEVGRGDVVGLIGRNGAGKSTLLKILSRIVDPSEGRAVLRGRVASLLEVGTGFHQDLTGRENVYLNGSILGMKRAEIARKFDEIVAFAEIERFLDTPVKHYSSGMYVRLAFAVAAHLEPEILIVDEVLAVGDAEFQRKCLGKMREVSTGSGRTVIFVSHNMAAVRSLCSSAVLLERGRVAAVGPADAVVDRYMTAGLGGGPTACVEFAAPRGAAMRMVRAEFLVAGRRDAVLPYGVPATLRVEFAADPPSDNVCLGFAVLAPDGTRVLAANNRYRGTEGAGTPASGGVLEADLGVLPLTAGRYSISLSLGDEIFDTHAVEGALTLEVVERDQFGHGRLPPTTYPAIWWPASFRRVPGGVATGAAG